METAAVNGKGIYCWYVEGTTCSAVLKGEGKIDAPWKLLKDGFTDVGSRKSAEQNIIDNLFKVEGYRYNRSKTGVTSSRLLCTQRSDTARGAVPEESQRKRRRRETVKMENCRGVLTLIFSSRGPTIISCLHEYIHESVPQVSRVAEEIAATIRTGVELGLSPFQVASELNRRGVGQFTWSQIYYKWSLMMEHLYKTSCDAKVSAKAFLGNSQKFKQTCALKT